MVEPISSIDILLTVMVTSCIQSIFGVGVLLFGTPMLLILGYGFIESISVLLPISLVINVLQILRHYRSIDWEFYRGVLFLTVPFVVGFLFLVTRVDINIGLLIGVYLLIVAAKEYSTSINDAIQFVAGYRKTYFVSMGIIHGLTNLGGSLLTALIYSRGYAKHVTRATVAVSYATFALFQLITLVLSDRGAVLEPVQLAFYASVGISVFGMTEYFVYREVDSANYSKYFSLFLFLSGLLLCGQSILHAAG